MAEQKKIVNVGEELVDKYNAPNIIEKWIGKISQWFDYIKNSDFTKVAKRILPYIPVVWDIQRVSKIKWYIEDKTGVDEAIKSMWWKAISRISDTEWQTRLEKAESAIKQDEDTILMQEKAKKEWQDYISPYQKRVIEMQEKLNTVPVYSAEFQNIKKNLSNAKVELAQKEKDFQMVVGDMVSQVEKDKQRENIRQPGKAYFKTSEDFANFNRETLYPLEFNPDGSVKQLDYKQSDALSRAKIWANEAMAIMQREIVNPLIKQWSIDDYQDYYNRPEVKQLVGQLSKTYYDAIAENYDAVTTDGKIDEAKLRKQLAMNDDVKNMRRQLDSFIEKEKDAQRTSAVTKRTEDIMKWLQEDKWVAHYIWGVWNLWGAILKNVIWDVDDSVYNLRNWIDWWDGDAAWFTPWKAIEESVVSQRRGSMLDDLLSNPVEAWIYAQMLVKSFPSLASSKSITLANSPLLRTIANKSPMLYKATEIIPYNRAIQGLKEIQNWLPLNFIIDSAMWEWDVWVNSAFDFGAGLLLPWFSKWGATRLADAIFSAWATDAKWLMARLWKAEEIWLKLWVDEVIDYTRLESAVNQKMTQIITDKDLLKSEMVKNVKSFLETSNSNNIEYYENMVDIFNTAFGKDAVDSFGSATKDIESLVSKARSSKYPEKYVAQIKQKVLDMATNLSSEWAEKLANMKIATEASTQWFDKVYNGFKKMGISDEWALIWATKFLITDSKTGDDVIEMIAKHSEADAAILEANRNNISKIASINNKVRDLVQDPIKNIIEIGKARQASLEVKNEFGELYDAVLGSKKAQAIGWLSTLDDVLDVYSVKWGQKIKNALGKIYDAITDFSGNVGKFWTYMKKAAKEYFDESWSGLDKATKKMFVDKISKIIDAGNIDSLWTFIRAKGIDKKSIEEIAEHVFKNIISDIAFWTEASIGEVFDTLKWLWLSSAYEIGADMRNAIDDLLDFWISESKGFVSGISADDVKSFIKWDIPEETVANIKKIDDIVWAMDKEFVKMLKNWLTIWGKKLVSNVYETANVIEKAMIDKTVPLIDVVYFTPDGKRVLSSLFDNRKDFTKLYNNAWNKQRNRMRNFAEVTSLLFDGNKIVTQKMIGNQTISISDILDRMPMRYSEGMIDEWREAAAFMPSLVLTQYLAQGDTAQEFLQSYAKVINEAFQKSLDVTWPEMIMDFTKLMWKEPNQVWEAVVDLWNKVRANIESLWIDGYKADWMVHPFLYNPLEYVATLSRASTADELLQQATARVLNLNKSSLTSHYTPEVKDAVLSYLRNTPSLDNVKWDYVWYQIKNSYTYGLNSLLTQAISDWKIPLNISKSWFEEFLYKTSGYFFTNSYLGMVAGKSWAELSKVMREVWEVTLEQESEIMSRLVNILKPDVTTGKYVKIDQNIKILNDYLTKIGKYNTNIQDIINNFKSIVVDQEENTSKFSAIDDMMNAINQNYNKYLQGLDKKPIEKTIEEILSESNTKQEFVQVAQKISDENYKRLSENVSSKFMFLSKDGQAFWQMLMQAGISKEQGIDILKSLWLTESSAKKYIEQGTKLSNEEVSEAVFRLSIDGWPTFFEALQKSPKFRAYTKSILETKAASNNGVKAFGIDASGKLYMTSDKVYSWFERNLMSLNLKAFDDSEMKNFVDSYIKWYNKNISDFNFQYGRLSGNKQASFNAYLSGVRDAIYEYTTANKISVEEFNSVLKNIFSNANGEMDFSKKALNMLKKDSWNKVLAEMLFDYFSDISKARWGIFASPDKLFHNPKSYETGTQSLTNAINRITGAWTMFNKDQILRVEQKLGGVEKASNQMNNIFYRGIFDKSIPRSISNGISQFITLAWFWFQNFNKWVQQSASNIISSNAIANSMGVDFPKLDELTKLIGEKYDIDLLRWGSIAAWWANASKILSYLNVMPVADQATKWFVQKAALVDAMYDTYEAFGTRWVQKFFEQADEMGSFMNAYGLTNFDMYSKERVIAKVWKWKIPDSALLKDIDKHVNFYQTKFADYKTKVRTSMALFYVTDNIPELWYIPFTDTWRALFPLKRWAIGKSAENVTRFSKEIQNKWLWWFIKSVMNGDSNAFNRIAWELATLIRIGWWVDRLTQWQVDTNTLLQYISVSVGSLLMSIGEAANIASTSYSDYKQWFEVSEQEMAGTKAMLLGLIAGMNQLKGTAFIYETNILTMFGKAWNTAAPKEEFSEQASTFISTLFKSFVMNNANKFFNVQYNWYGAPSDKDGTVVANMVEYFFNMQGNPRKENRRSIDRLYRLEAASEWFGKPFSREISNIIPLIWAFSRSFATEDMGITMDMADEYMDSKQLYLLSDKYAYSRDGWREAMLSFQDDFIRMKMIENINKLKTSMTNRDVLWIVSDYRKKYGDNFEDATDAQIQELWYIIGAWESPMLSSIKTYLKWGTSNLDQDVVNMEREITIGMDEFEELSNNYMEMFIANTKDWKEFTNEQLEKMLISSTQIGSNAVLSDYISAVQSWYKKALAKEMGVDDSRFDPDKPNWFFENWVAPSEKEIEYMNKLRQADSAIIETIRPIVGENSYVGDKLQIDYMSQMDDSPVPDISDTEVALLSQKLFYDTLVKDGYVSTEALEPSAAMSRKIAMSFLDTEKNIDKEAAAKMFVWQLNANVNATLQYYTSPVDRTIWLATTAYMLSPLFDEFATYAPEEFAELAKNKEFKQATEVAIDTLTEWIPTDFITGFEQASWVNLHKGDWKSGKDYKVRTEGAEKLAKAHNKAVDLALKLANVWFDISPVKYKVNITKGKPTLVSIEEVNVRQPWDIRASTPTWVKGRGSKTKQLRIAETRWVAKSIVSQRYKPRAIKNAKIYSKKVGR